MVNKQRQKKEETVGVVKEKLQHSQTVVLADYRGLNVAEVTELRAKLREAEIEFKVTKNTLTLIAARELGLNDLEQYLNGPTALAFGVKDPIAPAKILADFAKAHKALELKGGVVEGKVVDQQTVKALADLPSREELLAKLLGSMQLPLTGFAGALQGLLRNLVGVLDAIRQQQEANA